MDTSISSIGTTPALCVYAESSGGDDEVLEVSWVAWDTLLNLSRTQKILVSYSSFHSTSGCGISGSNGYGFSVPITQFYPAYPLGGDFAGFRIRVTPLRLPSPANGDVANFRVFTDPAVTSQIQVKSISSAAGQKQALAALFPWSLPLSGLFDFVIFSEKELKKDIPIQIANELKRYGPYDADVITCPGGVCTLLGVASTDPLYECNLAPCTYYLRLKAADGSGGWTATGATVNTTGTGGLQNIATLNASSCIMPLPYTFSSNVGQTVTFVNKPATLEKFELLTRPAFSTSDEGYCP
mgnify:FL=1